MVQVRDETLVNTSSTPRWPIPSAAGSGARLSRRSAVWQRPAAAVPAGPAGSPTVPAGADDAGADSGTDDAGPPVTGDAADDDSLPPRPPQAASNATRDIATTTGHPRPAFPS